MDRFDVVILGTGPSGLAAAYRLARDDRQVAVVERAPVAGGLMRGVKRGDFHFDIGRKELYTRYPEVHGLWTELLGSNYREYEHRVGMLYGGRILEKDSGPAGRLRGMSVAQTARMMASFLASQVKPGPRVANNLEEYYLLRYGRAYYDYFIHGFRRKFSGAPVTAVPSPEGVIEIPRFAVLQKRLGGSDQPEAAADLAWRHPSLGTQQIVDGLEGGGRSAGAQFLMNTEVLEVRTEGGRVRSVLVREKGGERELQTDVVIAGIPLPLLMKVLRPLPPEALRTPPKEEVVFRRSTVLVYLMAEGEPRFRHNWVEVNDMTLKVGRVVNYGTLNGAMVPPGKTGLCMEYFCVEGDGTIDLSEDELKELAITEAVRGGLIDRQRIFDVLVLKLPSANASTVAEDWKVQWMRRASAHSNGIAGLYETNRPGIDRAALAGLDAAEACTAGTPMNPRSLEKAPE